MTCLHDLVHVWITHSVLLCAILESPRVLGVRLDSVRVELGLRQLVGHDAPQLLDGLSEPCLTQTRVEAVAVGRYDQLGHTPTLVLAPARPRYRRWRRHH